MHIWLPLPVWDEHIVRWRPPAWVKVHNRVDLTDEFQILVAPRLVSIGLAQSMVFFKFMVGLDITLVRQLVPSAGRKRGGLGESTPSCSRAGFVAVQRHVMRAQPRSLLEQTQRRARVQEPVN